MPPSRKSEVAVDPRGSGRSARERSIEAFTGEVDDRSAERNRIFSHTELGHAQGEPFVAAVPEAEQPERVVGAVARLLHHREQRARGVTDPDAGRVGPTRQHLLDGVRVHVGDDIGRERVAVVRSIALPHRWRVHDDDDEPTVHEAPRHAVVPELGRGLQIEIAT